MSLIPRLYHDVRAVVWREVFDTNQLYQALLSLFDLKELCSLTRDGTVIKLVSFSNGAPVFEQKLRASLKGAADERNNFVTSFFNQYPTPTVIIVNECDGRSQYIANVLTAKYIIQDFFNQNQNLNILSAPDSFVGLSYGNLFVPFMVKYAREIKEKAIANNDIDRINQSLDDILSYWGALKKKNTSFSDMCFSWMFYCFKYIGENQDIDNVVDSQFDQISPTNAKEFGQKFFPEGLNDSKLALYQSETQIDQEANLDKIFYNIVKEQNELASKNKVAMYKNQVTMIAGALGNLVEDIPILSGLKHVGKLQSGIVRLSTTTSNEHYKQEIDNILNEKGVVVFNLNSDNTKNGTYSTLLDVNTDILKRRLTIKITNELPFTAYEDPNYAENINQSIAAHFEKSTFSKLTLNAFYNIINNKS